MSTLFFDNDQSTTSISKDISTFVSEEKSTGMYFLLNYVHITFTYF